MNLKKTTEKTIKSLYQLTYDTSRILEKNNIPYWVIAGSALGLKRHGGIIPWDDDVDIGIDKRDSRNLKTLKKAFKKCGIGLTKHWLGHKVYYLDSPVIGNVKHGFPSLDIFNMEFDKGKIKYSSNKARNLWPKEYFYPEELFPLKKYTFGEIEVYGANNYKKYLDRAYKNWYTVAYREYDHEKREEVETVKVKLKDKDRVPAKPTKVKKKRCL
jgi:lipopolysaccharide cholinephosphotransferase